MIEGYNAAENPEEPDPARLTDQQIEEIEAKLERLRPVYANDLSRAGRAVSYTLIGTDLLLAELRAERATNEKLREAYTRSCWDLATFTYRGRDVSLGEEAEALQHHYLAEALDA